MAFLGETATISLAWDYTAHLSFSYFIQVQAFILHPVEEAGVSHLAWLHCGCIPDLTIHHPTHINNT